MKNVIEYYEEFNLVPRDFSWLKVPGNEVVRNFKCRNDIKS